MRIKLSDKEAVDAVAEAWASIDGHLEDYKFEEQNPSIGYNDTRYTGHYDGYQSEAKELIERIAARGFVLVKDRG